MSFIGKQFKKVKVDNGPEFFEKLNLSEQVLSLLRQKESITTFTKNADGNLQYVVKVGGNVVLNQQVVLDKEVDYTTPDGIVTKVLFTLQGDQLKSHMKFPNGTVVHMDRSFDAKGFTLELYVDGNNTKATVHYDVV